VLLAALLGSALALVTFVWLRLVVYSAQELSPLLPLWAILFAAGFAVSPFFSGVDLLSLLFRIAFAALGVFVALYLSAATSNPVISVGKPDQHLILILFAGIFMAGFSFLPETTAYFQEQIRRSSRTAQPAAQPGEEPET